MIIDVDKAAEEILIELGDGSIHSAMHSEERIANEGVNYVMPRIYALNLLKERGFIDIRFNQYPIPHTLNITNKGLDVLRSGGYIKLRQREGVLSEKEIHDANLTAFNYKTRWWPHIISIISLILSIFAIILTLTK